MLHVTDVVRGGNHLLRLSVSVSDLEVRVILFVNENAVITVYLSFTMVTYGDRLPIYQILFIIRELCMIVELDWVDAFDVKIVCRRKLSHPQTMDMAEMSEGWVTSYKYHNTFTYSTTSIDIQKQNSNITCLISYKSIV